VRDADEVVLLRAERWPGEAGPAQASPGPLALHVVRDVAGKGVGTPVVVAVQASDEFVAAGAMAYLRSKPGITPIPASRTAEADVVLVLADRLTGDMAAWIQQSAETHDSGMVRFVLVSDWIPVPQLMRAASCALLSVLPRQGSDYEQVVRAIFQMRGRPELPAVALRSLPPGEFGAGDPGAAMDGAAMDGAATGLVQGRELDILRLVADGLDTAEIAQRMNYSERTIKNVIHTMLNRLQLKNRPHAVAFAIRNGLL
jgi:DNA-binding NarL/FixJ family response regulator